MSTPDGLRRDWLSILHFGHPTRTVVQDSQAADAIRKTPQYKDAYKEAVAWQKAVETAEAKAAGRKVNPDAVCGPSCDVFALNAAANGWVIGEKIEASTDNYTPQVADNQRDHLGGEPLDVNSLGAQQAQREPAPSTATPDAATRDLTRYEPVPAEPLAHGGRSL